MFLSTPLLSTHPTLSLFTLYSLQSPLVSFSLSYNRIGYLNMSRKIEGTGPHNERMASLNQRLSNNEVMQLFPHKSDNPLKQLVDKFRRQARNNDPYPQQHLQHKIDPLDKLLEYNSRLAPILTSLQRQNNTLRGEISIISHELSKSLNLCEALISENKELKEIVLNKNEDITKIIETIAINETEMRGELEHKNYLLQQENSILIKHLEQIKVDKTSWNSQMISIEDQASRLTRQVIEAEANLEEALGREKDVSKRLYLTEQSLIQASDQLSETKRQLEDKLLDHNRLKNQLELVKVEDKASIKDRFEAEISNIIQEYEVLKEERGVIVNEAEKLRVESDHWKNKASALERELEKAISNLELTNSLLNEQKTKNANLSSNNSKMEIRVSQLKLNTESMRLQLERAQNISAQKGKMYQKEIDTLRGDIEQRNLELDRKLKEIRQSADNEMQRKHREIEDLKRNNEQLKSMVDRSR